MIEDKFLGKLTLKEFNTIVKEITQTIYNSSINKIHEQIIYMESKNAKNEAIFYLIFKFLSTLNLNILSSIGDISQEKNIHQIKKIDLRKLYEGFHGMISGDLEVFIKEMEKR